MITQFYDVECWPLTSVRLASDTPSLRSMSVPSDLQRGREVLLLALIRWAAMMRPFTEHNAVTSTTLGHFLSPGNNGCQQLSRISEKHRVQNDSNLHYQWVFSLKVSTDVWIILQSISTHFGNCQLIRYVVFSRELKGLQACASFSGVQMHVYRTGI